MSAATQWQSRDRCLDCARRQVSRLICPALAGAAAPRCYRVASLGPSSVEGWYRCSQHGDCALYTDCKAEYHYIFPSFVYMDHRPYDHVRHDYRQSLRPSILLGDPSSVLLLDAWSWHGQLCRRVVGGNASDHHCRVSAGTAHDPKTSRQGSFGAKTEVGIRCSGVGPSSRWY